MSTIAPNGSTTPLPSSGADVSLSNTFESEQIAGAGATVSYRIDGTSGTGYNQVTVSGVRTADREFCSASRG